MPLSSRPGARARQLANLNRGGNPAPLGNQRHRSHGGYARVARPQLEAKEREVFDALAEDAPLRDVDGGLPRPDALVVTLLAKALCRLEGVEAYTRLYGSVEFKTGNVRPAAELERRLRAEALDYAEALGMTPRSRARLGLDLARTTDLAIAMSEPDPDRRRQLLRDAGLDQEDDE